MRHTLLLLPTMAAALRKVLVTGANKGIGKRIATRILTDIDDSFVYLGARDAGRGAAAVADILAEHPEAEGRLELLELDTESDASVEAAAAKVDSLWGLCNNAGVGFGRSIADTCVEIKILRRVRAESSSRPPRHRRDACSMAWRCRFLAARPSQVGRVIAEK